MITRRVPSHGNVRKKVGSGGPSLYRRIAPGCRQSGGQLGWLPSTGKRSCPTTQIHSYLSRAVQQVSKLTKAVGGSPLVVALTKRGL